MALVQTDDPRVVRDTNTRALLATNTDELHRHRRSRATMKQLKQLKQQQQDSDERFDIIHGRLDRCESLLLELVQHISTLTAKYPDPLSKRD
jgi:hypothetical protein